MNLVENKRDKKRQENEEGGTDVRFVPHPFHFLRTPPTPTTATILKQFHRLPIIFLYTQTDLFKVKKKGAGTDGKYTRY